MPRGDLSQQVLPELKCRGRNLEMPNTGKPSRGCEECKARKVKVCTSISGCLSSLCLRSYSVHCDQTFPACQRCQRNIRRCSGYPNPLDIALRNTFSTDVTQQRRLTSLSENARHHSYSTVPRPMTRYWHNQAVCMFFHDYLVSQVNTCSGWMKK